MISFKANEFSLLHFTLSNKQNKTSVFYPHYLVSVETILSDGITTRMSNTADNSTMEDAVEMATTLKPSRIVRDVVRNLSRQPHHQLQNSDQVIHRDS